MSTYIAGQTIQLTGQFTDAAGAAADPAGAVLVVQRLGSPDAPAVEATWPGPGFDHPTNGTLAYLWTPTAAGIYGVRWQSTGGPTTVVGDAELVVRAPLA